MGRLRSTMGRRGSSCFLRCSQFQLWLCPSWRVCPSQCYGWRPTDSRGDSSRFPTTGFRGFPNDSKRSPANCCRCRGGGSLRCDLHRLSTAPGFPSEGWCLEEHQALRSHVQHPIPGDVHHWKFHVQVPDHYRFQGSAWRNEQLRSRGSATNVKLEVREATYGKTYSTPRLACDARWRPLFRVCAKMPSITCRIGLFRLRRNGGGHRTLQQQENSYGSMPLSIRIPSSFTFRVGHVLDHTY